MDFFISLDRFGQFGQTKRAAQRVVLNRTGWKLTVSLLALVCCPGQPRTCPDNDELARPEPQDRVLVHVVPTLNAIGESRAAL